MVVCPKLSLHLSTSIQSLSLSAFGLHVLVLLLVPFAYSVNVFVSLVESLCLNRKHTPKSHKCT